MHACLWSLNAYSINLCISLFLILLDHDFHPFVLYIYCSLNITFIPVVMATPNSSMHTFCIYGLDGLQACIHMLPLHMCMLLISYCPWSLTAQLHSTVLHISRLTAPKSSYVCVRYHLILFIWSICYLSLLPLLYTLVCAPICYMSPLLTVLNWYYIYIVICSWLCIYHVHCLRICMWCSVLSLLV